MKLMANMEELLSTVREKQKRQISEYEAQTFFIGEALEILWEGHLPVRCYINKPKVSLQKPMGVYINCHGGGFIEGDAKQMGTFCQKISDALGILVVNFNYRLSPDYVYPYQCEELDRVFEYLETNADVLNIDLNHLGIGGFSAGATLSLNSVVRCIEKGEKRYSVCVLGYPMTSADPTEIDWSSKYPACDEVMGKVVNYYFNGNDLTPACSVLNAPNEILEQFPSVIEITCGKDSICAMGRKFAARLAAIGVRLNYIEYKDARHGFIEVNRPDYEPDDPRKTPEQAELNEIAEKFIIDGLASML